MAERLCCTGNNAVKESDQGPMGARICGSRTRAVRIDAAYCCSEAVALAVRFLTESGVVKDQVSATAGPEDSWTEPAAIFVFLPTMTSKLL